MTHAVQNEAFAPSKAVRSSMKVNAFPLLQVPVDTKQCSQALFQLLLMVTTELTTVPSPRIISHAVLTREI